MVNPILLSLTSTQKRNPSKGFTLVELLVVLFIGGAIISGLMYLAVELLTTDNRESTRTETQRDLQHALDFMSNELREAIYIYPDVIDPETNALFDFFPADNPDFGEPVLAFWKQQRLPRQVRDRCAVEANLDDPGFRQTCLRGYSYTLVVYSLDGVNDNADDWRGRAQIVRSAMTQFDLDTGDDNGEGYVTPLDNASVAFRSWPPDDSNPVFNQIDVLTDFVDDGAGSEGRAQVRSGDCPNPANAPVGEEPYAPSPSQPINGTVRSFYACVTQPGVNADGTQRSAASRNQEVIVYLQGNANGRSGIFGEDTFLPTLETRVLTRGILDKSF
ncbi:MAG: prepilin-type N-terminal cleavage/methylation domain-containing protein [Leptolyngbyaceae bacterium]|nr:prepilin-type N-terminal cleavage/methylation domain-containing protein [Leptolyngbyaceae bacterium]